MYQKHLFIANIDNTPQSWVTAKNLIKVCSFRYESLTCKCFCTDIAAQSKFDAGCILLKSREEWGGGGGVGAGWAAGGLMQKRWECQSQK